LPSSKNQMFWMYALFKDERVWSTLDESRIRCFLNFVFCTIITIYRSSTDFPLSVKYKIHKINTTKYNIIYVRVSVRECLNYIPTVYIIYHYFICVLTVCIEIYYASRRWLNYLSPVNSKMLVLIRYQRIFLGLFFQSWTILYVSMYFTNYKIVFVQIVCVIYIVNIISSLWYIIVCINYVYTHICVTCVYHIARNPAGFYVSILI